MPVCPSVPLNNGDELQCPRAAQPGQGWEQLESAADDASFSWQEDFLDLFVHCEMHPSHYSSQAASPSSCYPKLGTSTQPCDSSLQGQAGWSQGIQHWPGLSSCSWSCSSSGSPVAPLHPEHCDFRVCCTLDAQVWKPGISNPWQSTRKNAGGRG